MVHMKSIMRMRSVMVLRAHLGSIMRVQMVLTMNCEGKDCVNHDGEGIDGADWMDHDGKDAYQSSC